MSESKPIHISDVAMRIIFASIDSIVALDAEIEKLKAENAELKEAGRWHETGKESPDDGECVIAISRTCDEIVFYHYCESFERNLRGEFYQEFAFWQHKPNLVKVKR